MSGTMAPLIVTVRMDQAAFDRFDRLRREHFPSELNLIPAHVTLFHALPGDRSEAVLGILEDACRDAAPLELRAAGVKLLGRGVAYAIEGDGLRALRGRLARSFEPWLTPQDRQGFRPHVTIQNKVAPQAARTLHTHLSAAFVPFTFPADGVLTWRYLGGPWELLRATPFAAAMPG